MKIEIHIHVHSDTRMDYLLRILQSMSPQLEALSAAVAAEGTVIESAVVLLTGLSRQITDLKNDPAALQTLSDQVKAESDALAAAVLANTPAEIPATPSDVNAGASPAGS